MLIGNIFEVRSLAKNIARGEEARFDISAMVYSEQDVDRLCLELDNQGYQVYWVFGRESAQYHVFVSPLPLKKCS